MGTIAVHIKPIALALEGISRQRYTVASKSIVPPKVSPVYLHTLRIEPPQALQYLVLYMIAGILSFGPKFSGSQISTAIFTPSRIGM